MVGKPAPVIPFNSAVHSEKLGTLNPVGQGLFTPPSVLFQGCTSHTPPVWEFQLACDVQGCALIELVLLDEMSVNLVAVCVADLS